MIYVDDMRAKFGRMLLSHLFADTDDELHAMAARIGVARKWHRAPPHASTSHYDIAEGKRDLAIAAGARPVSWRQFGLMCKGRRGNPDAPLDKTCLVAHVTPRLGAL